MSLTAYPDGISVYGVPIFPAGQDCSGKTWFVDNNSGSDSNDGLTWDSAFSTLAKAIAISNADIARSDQRHWARRNTIYYCADTETADLVVFPNKTDVIGVGSYDANTKPGITGNHVPVNSGNYGGRFINVWFKAPADASPIVTLASTSSGIQFIDCVFDATATTTIGIQATASPFLQVLNCDFRGAFVTSNITLGTGEAGRTIIYGNRMTGAAAKAIIIGSGTTASWEMIIQNNFIEAATFCIDDDSDLAYVVGNHMISLADDYATGLDVNAARCVGNWYTAPNVSSQYPAEDTTT